MNEAGSDAMFTLAVEEAEKSAKEGGIPIGAVLVSKDGTILGKGHNERVQKSSAVLHAEMAALEDSGRRSGSEYKDATMYTTLSPCDMCSGACYFYGIKTVVLGENSTRVGAEDYLRGKGIQVVNRHDKRCEELLGKFIAEHPDIWYEDIAE